MFVFLCPGEEGARNLCLDLLGLLCRAQATIQSTTFWVVSKAYQFLASWSLTKFVLLTQGDLKVQRTLFILEFILLCRKSVRSMH